MGPLAADSEEVLASRPRALAAIQAHRRIARVRARGAAERDNKSAAGKAFKDVPEVDAAGVNQFLKSKN